MPAIAQDITIDVGGDWFADLSAANSDGSILFDDARMTVKCENVVLALTVGSGITISSDKKTVSFVITVAQGRTLPVSTGRWQLFLTVAGKIVPTFSGRAIVRGELA